MKDIRENIFYPYRHYVQLYDYPINTAANMMCHRYMKYQRKQGRKCDSCTVFAQMQEFLKYWKKNRVW